MRRAPSRPQRATATAVPETGPDDLFDYADEPAPDGRERRRSPLRIVDMESLPVFDDWPEKVPITEAEHLGGIMTALEHAEFGLKPT